MWEFIIDLIIDVLRLLGYRKKRKKDTELLSLKTNDSTPQQDTSGGATREGVSVCSGCYRILESGAIFEHGKPWCKECYKTHILKVKG
jgi:protein-arginine kinase activator protein McsA